jgi:hypothetical protein
MTWTGWQKHHKGSSRWLTMRRILVGVICFFSWPVHAAQRDNFSAWFVDSLVKVFPDSPAATSKLELALVSARNGHSSLQVALRSESLRAWGVRHSGSKFTEWGWSK